MKPTNISVGNIAALRPVLPTPHDSTAYLDLNNHMNTCITGTCAFRQRRRHATRPFRSQHASSIEHRARARWIWSTRPASSSSKVIADNEVCVYARMVARSAKMIHCRPCSLINESTGKVAFAHRVHQHAGWKPANARRFRVPPRFLTRIDACAGQRNKTNLPERTELAARCRVSGHCPPDIASPSVKRASEVFRVNNLSTNLGVWFYQGAG